MSLTSKQIDQVHSRFQSKARHRMGQYERDEASTIFHELIAEANANEPSKLRKLIPKRPSTIAGIAAGGVIVTALYYVGSMIGW